MILKSRLYFLAQICLFRSSFIKWQSESFTFGKILQMRSILLKSIFAQKPNWRQFWAKNTHFYIYYHEILHTEPQQHNNKSVHSVQKTIQFEREYCNCVETSSNFKGPSSSNRFDLFIFARTNDLHLSAAKYSQRLIWIACIDTGGHTI